MKLLDQISGLVPSLPGFECGKAVVVVMVIKATCEWHEAEGCDALHIEEQANNGIQSIKLLRQAKASGFSSDQGNMRIGLEN